MKEHLAAEVLYFGTLGFLFVLDFFALPKAEDQKHL